MGSSPRLRKKEAQKLDDKSLAALAREDSQREIRKGHYDPWFVVKDSTLTSLLQISHFQTIYNILLAILLVSLADLCLNNYVEYGSPLDISLFLWNFEGFPVALVIWLGYFVATFAVVPLEQFTRKYFPSSRPRLHYSLLLLFAVTCPILVRRIFDFPPATSTFVIAEVVRFCMKMHSFTLVTQSLRKKKLQQTENRNNEPEGMEEEATRQYPSNITWQSFFYFLWAPCLLYQPSYPRTPSIRWNFVFARFTEVILCVVYIYAIFTRSILPVVHQLSLGWIPTVLAMFRLMIPMLAVSVMMHYLLLHCWLNAFAELTRFADRQFYLDWWNSGNWATYYRKWNYVVHSFIYRHIYKELLEEWQFSRRVAMGVTFIISAIVHEYVIFLAIGVFAPFLFIIFLVLGVPFIPLTRHFHSRAANIFMWAMLIMGHGVLMGLYGLAWMNHYYPQIAEHSDVID